MSSSFKTIGEILSATSALKEQLFNAEVYLAHRPREGSDIPAESLEEHVGLVLRYFGNIVEAHRLDSVIDKLIDGLHEKVDIETGNYVKLLFVNAIVYHDYGKINEAFQAKKMHNIHFKESGSAITCIGTTHSALGAFIYLTKHLNDIIGQFKSTSQHILLTACVYLSYSIFKHHSRCLNDSCGSTIGFETYQTNYNFDEVLEFLSAYTKAYNVHINPFILQRIKDNAFTKHQSLLPYRRSFSLYALCRLNFSLLTASDYMATNHYSNQLTVDDYGVLTNSRIDSLYQDISQNEWFDEAAGRRNYNKAVFAADENDVLENPTIVNGDNLNTLRKEMAIEVIRNIRKNSDRNLFYIEAPTGGGKTNLSALAAIELLKIHRGQYNKVFYVFPFTTLITQTYKFFKDTFSLTESEMVELHARAGMKVNKEEDDDYGNEKLNYINHLFVNFPFTFLSHIRFFDILKTNEKETNYLLHRLANSIVIIDELQSYNPIHWEKVIYFILQYADKFNIKFILMSATLPKLEKLNVIKEGVQDFVYLLPDAKALYFNNPNFARRVTFSFDLLEKKEIDLRELANRLLEESEAYAAKDFGDAKPLNSVYTVIEFIFKQTATLFYDLIKESMFFDEVFVLSGTILEHRRRYIINFLKNRQNRKKKVLLITTQVVEAGVDIDMDLGFKDRSLIDSDEQLAGRINRNVNKQDCTLFLFNYNKEAIIYGKDKRFELTRKHIDQAQHHEILCNKDFDRLYDLVLNDRNEWNKKEMAAGFDEYEEKIKALKFKSVHDEFRLIDQHNISCFVPANIPVKVDGVMPGREEVIFSEMELSFLEKYGVYPNENNEIAGEKVFDVYLNLITNKQEFIVKKASEKILQGIISKFVFSLFANKTIESQLILFSDEEKSGYGYKYLERWSEIYDVKTGLSDRNVNSAESQFL